MSEKLRSNQYISIQSEMVSDLKLKGDELIVFALINGYSNVNDQWFTASLTYIGQWLCNASRQNVKRIIDKLLAKGLLIKGNFKENNVNFCRYKINQGRMDQMIKQSNELRKKEQLTRTVDSSQNRRGIQTTIDDYDSDDMPFK